MSGPFGGLREGLSKADVGCAGAVVLVLLTAGGILGLLAVVWWGLREFL
jgi:hypothetical protein